MTGSCSSLVQLRAPVNRTTRVTSSRWTSLRVESAAASGTTLSLHGSASKVLRAANLGAKLHGPDRALFPGANLP